MRTYPGIRALVLLGALSIALATGCSTNKTVQPVVTDPAPPPNSPVGAAKRIEWDWNRFDPHYSDMLTDDFVFVAAISDTIGHFGVSDPWTREVERLALQRMFDRQAELPKLLDLTLHFDPAPVAMPDPRPGKTPKFHRVVHTNLDLLADVAVGGGMTERWNVSGASALFFVRGDSAAIPQDLVERGFRPDSTQWWLERWEDVTVLAGTALNPQPVGNRTLAQFKFVFLPPVIR